MYGLRYFSARARALRWLCALRPVAIRVCNHWSTAVATVRPLGDWVRPRRFVLRMPAPPRAPAAREVAGEFCTIEQIDALPRQVPSVLHLGTVQEPLPRSAFSAGHSRTHSCSDPWPSVPDAGTWGLDAWGEVRKAGWLLLTSYHIYSMVKCMKTTLNIDSTVMQRLRQEAARQGRTMSDIVESALRLFFKSTRERRPLPDLPSFDSGGSLVDIADREALYGAMEGR